MGMRSELSTSKLRQWSMLKQNLDNDRLLIVRKGWEFVEAKLG